jgi:MFS_1 like family
MLQLGLSPAETAVIFSLSTIVTAFVRAVVGLIADKSRHHKIILIACCIVSGFLHLLLLLVPGESHADLELNHNSSLLEARCINGSNIEFFLCETSNSKSESEFTTKSSHDIKEMLNKTTMLWHSCEIKCCGNASQMTQILEQNSSRLLPTSYQSNNSCAVNLLSVLTAYSVEKDKNHSDGVCTHYQSRLTNVGDSLVICNMVNEHQCSVTCGNWTQNLGTGTVKVVSKFGRTFLIFFIIYLVASCIFSPVISIVDGLAYNCLGDGRMKFGRQRCWGSVGYGLCGVISSIIMDTLQTSDADKNYTYSFILFAVFLLLTALIVYHLEATVEVIAGSLMSNVGKILCNLELDLLMLTAFLAGFLCGAQEGFLFWFIRTLDGPQIVMGLCGLIQCSTEIFILFFSGSIVVKFGTMNCLCAVFAAFGVRFMLYSFLVNPWCVLSIEPLHSICYGLFYPAMTIRASELTPAGMHATVQSFLGTLYISVGEYDHLFTVYLLQILDVKLTILCN